MAILLGLYIALYTGAALRSLWEDARTDTPRAKAVLSTVGNALGIAGMLLYATDTTDARIAAAWVFVLPLLAAQAVVELRHAAKHRLRRLLPELEHGDPQARSLVHTSLLLGVLFSLPYYWMNVRLAFPSAAP